MQVGSALYARVGTPQLCTLISAALIVVYIPVAILLLPYAETPECWRRRRAAREEAQAREEEQAREGTAA